MARQLLVKIEQLTEEQRLRIRTAAEGHRWQVCFADRETPGSVGETEVLFSWDQDLIRRCRALKWLCVPSAGVESYLAPGVLPGDETMLTNSSGAYGVTIAEHIVMTALMMMRRQAEYQEITAERRWVRNLPIRSIKGSRIVMLGTGDIGRTAAARLRAFQPALLVGVNRSGLCPDSPFDRVLPLEALNGVLPDADLLILSLPATPGTRHLMDRERLSLLPQQALIINVGRGSTIDQGCLLGMLREGRLAGAALDVFEEEPIPAEDDAWDCPNLLITPHISGNMTLPYTVERIVDLFLDDFERYVAGQPLRSPVTRGKGY